jgi:UDP-N-acetylglucosamine/UDP-N-acetylgalactosamine diphosphorylase
MSDASKVPQPVQRLLEAGVRIPCPFSVEVDASVRPERIAPGVILHTGCRIAGAETSIGPGSELGREGPVALEDCQLGHNVELKGGFFAGATFLDGANMGSAAQVRPATLLEEEAGGAHAVGLKQTIFLSFTTAGSLINFCDALMAGGTSRKNHSEIGSSYIHFNFTPHQDKATPSLVGDVPRGVFLNQQPIFLGGQGGLVGPARIAYGTIIPAGTICRQDILDEGILFASREHAGPPRPFAMGVYRGITRIVRNNLIYIGNLWALKAWYCSVRIRTMAADSFARHCHAGALQRIEDGLAERVKRLREMVEKMPHSLRQARAAAGGDFPAPIIAQQQRLLDQWPEMEAALIAGPPDSAGAIQRDRFLREWGQADAASGHCRAVSRLSPSACNAGTAWLQEIVDSASALWQEI